MKNEKLEELVEELRKKYVEEQGEYAMASLFSSGAHAHVMDFCEHIISKINQIYGTNYSLQEEGKKW